MKLRIVVNNFLIVNFKSNKLSLQFGVKMKEQLIQLLKEGDGWLSGEALSRHFGVSRMAIAKHIQSLRQEGYLIEAVTRRGYQLKQAPDEIHLAVIQKEINTTVIGQGEWDLLDETESTNQYAMQKAAEGMPNGSVIIAGKQGSGRATKGKKWFSSPRGIAFSVVLRPNVALHRLDSVKFIGMLAIQDTLKTIAQMDITLQRPNNFIMNHKKMGGVLIETALIANDIDWLVLGIGCNLNAEIEEFPKEMHDNVTSVYNETQHIVVRDLFYQEVIQQLDHYYHLFIHEPAQFDTLCAARITD